MSELTLEPVTPENYEAVIALKVADHQQDFVAPTLRSLADAYVYKSALTRAARVGDDIVGFALIIPEQPTALIVRLLIDARFQRLGHGRALVAAIIDWIAALEPRPARMRISAKPENEVALNLYRSFGFEDDGFEHGEVVLVRAL